MDTHQQKISHLKALYHLASSDDDITKIELVYIKTVAERLGLQLEALGNFDGNEPTLELPNREYKLYGMFHRLAIIIMIDNTLDVQERQFCFNLGIKMGLHPNAVGEVIDHVVAKGSFNAQPSEIMTIFKKYLN